MGRFYVTLSSFLRQHSKGVSVNWQKDRAFTQRLLMIPGLETVGAIRLFCFLMRKSVKIPPRYCIYASDPLYFSSADGKIKARFQDVRIDCFVGSALLWGAGTGEPEIFSKGSEKDA